VVTPDVEKRLIARKERKIKSGCKDVPRAGEWIAA
jgi:hypothetical protein